MKRELISYFWNKEWKQYIIVLAIMVGFNLLDILTGWRASRGEMGQIAALAINVVCGYWALNAICCTLFAPYRDKQTMLLPASKDDKFWVRVLFSLPLWILVLLLGTLPFNMSPLSDPRTGKLAMDIIARLAFFGSLGLLIGLHSKKFGFGILYLIWTVWAGAGMAIVYWHNHSTSALATWYNDHFDVIMISELVVYVLLAIVNVFLARKSFQKWEAIEC